MDTDTVYDDNDDGDGDDARCLVHIERRMSNVEATRSEQGHIYIVLASHRT